MDIVDLVSALLVYVGALAAALERIETRVSALESRLDELHP